ncbi:hypothetical protein P4C99_14505 [Pontiellaceae bacterium B1224]|nr:hypothetical protein [Pontiellaceae bacterium B1224]
MNWCVALLIDDPIDCNLQDDRQVILLEADGRLHFYDMENYSVCAVPFDRELKTLSRADFPQKTVLSTSNDVYLAELHSDGSILAKPLKSVPHNSIAYDPRGRYLAMVCNSFGRIFNLATGEQELEFKNSKRLGSFWINFDDSGQFLYYGGDWRSDMRVYETGSWSNIVSLTYHTEKQAHFTDVQMDSSRVTPRLLLTRGGPKMFESYSINPDTLVMTTNWISHTSSSPLAIIPFNDPSSSERKYWCKLWFQDFQLYDAETGDASTFQNHWKRRGLGHPEFISKDPRVIFPMEGGRLQMALKSDLYPVFDPRAIDLKVDQAVLNTDASRLYLLSDGQLHCMKLPTCEE